MASGRGRVGAGVGMRAFLVAVMALAGGCATARPVDREATGIQMMAVGGGLVATGGISSVGAIVAAGYTAITLSHVGASLRDEVGGPLLAMTGGAAAVAGIQVVVGILLLKNGRCVYQGDACTEVVAPEQSAAARAAGEARVNEFREKMRARKRAEALGETSGPNVDRAAGDTQPDDQ